MIDSALSVFLRNLLIGLQVSEIPDQLHCGFYKEGHADLISVPDHFIHPRTYKEGFDFKYLSSVCYHGEL
jgi:hypothetical protein